MIKIRLSDGKGRGYSGLARVFTILALMLFVSMGAWAQTNYNVSAEDAGDWTITPNPTTAGTEVTVKYTGTKLVKSLKVKKAKATVTEAPQAKTGIKAGENTAIINAGATSEGTMMYAVTNEDTQPTSTDGFSGAVPTAEDLSAGTYYVWYYVQGDASHIDSEIAGPVPVTVIMPATVTTAPAPKTKVLRGSSMTLCSVGEASNGTMMYAVSTSNTSAPTSGYKSSVPKGSDFTSAGNYYIWYYAQGNSGYADSEKYVTTNYVVVKNESSETISTTNGTATGTHFTVEGNKFSTMYKLIITSKYNNEYITKVVLNLTSHNSNNSITSSDYTAVYTGTGIGTFGGYYTITNNTTGTIGSPLTIKGDNGLDLVSSVEVYYY